MPKKNRDHVPKDMEELEKIYYGPDKDGRNIDLFRQRRYEDNLRTHVLSPKHEDDVEKMFAPLGIIERIRENKKRPTFDYKIDARKLLLEVKSLNVPPASENLTKLDIFKKLEGTIDRILTKDPSPFPGYRKGGVVVYTLIFNFKSKFDKLLDNNLSKDMGMLKNNLDFLVFFHESASINNKSSWELYPIVFYVKDESLAEEFKNAFRSRNCEFFPG